MKKQGAEIMPGVSKIFTEGADRFFNKGINGRWRGVFDQDDLDLYDAKLKAILPPACIKWLEFGRQGATNPE
jgi:aryl sulfotransferase